MKASETSSQHSGGGISVRLLGEAPMKGRHEEKTTSSSVQAAEGSIIGESPASTAEVRFGR